VNVREGDCFVVWSVVSFVSAETQGDGVEDDCNGRFVSEGADEYDEGWFGLELESCGQYKTPV